MHFPLVKIMKTTLLATLLMALLGVGFLAFHFAEPLTQSLLTQLLAHIEEEYSLEVAWDRVVLFPIHRLVLEGLTVSQPGQDPFFQGERVVVQYNLWDLILNGDAIGASIEELRLHGSQFDADALLALDLNQDLSLDQGGGFAAPVRILDSQGSMTFGEKQEVLKLKHAEILPQASGSWLMKGQGHLLDAEDSILVLEGLIHNNNQDMDLNVHLEGFPLQPWNAYWASHVPGDFQVEDGYLSGDIALQFSLEEGLKGYQGQIQVNQGRVQIGAFPGVHNIEVSLNITPYEIQAGHVQMSLEDMVLEGEGRYSLHSETGRGSLSLSGVDLAQLSSLLEQGGITLPPLAGKGQLDLELNGSLSDPQVNGWLEVHDLIYEDVHLSHLEGGFSYQEDLLLLRDLQATHKSGGLLKGEGHLVWEQGTPYLMVRTEVENLDLAHMPSWPDLPEELQTLEGILEGTAFISGKALGREHLSVMGTLGGRDMGMADWEMASAQASFWFKEGELYLNPLTVQDAQGGILSVQGTLTEEWAYDVQVEAKGVDLAQYTGEIQGRGDFAGRLYGKGENPSLEGEVQLWDLVYGEYGMQYLEGSLAGNLEEWYLDDVYLEHELGKGTLSGTIGLHPQVTLNLQGAISSPSLAAWGQYLEQDFPADIDGRANARLALQGPLEDLQVSGQLTLEDGEVEGQPFQYLQANLFWDGREIKINEFAFQLTQGRIMGDGRINPYHLLELDIALEDIPVEEIEILQAHFPQIGGMVSFSGMIGGSIETPRLKGKITVKDGRWETIYLGDLEGDIFLDETMFSTQEMILSSSLGEYKLEGKAGLTDGGSLDMSLEFETKEAQNIIQILGLERKLPESLALSSLQAKGHGHLGGTLDTPELSFFSQVDYQHGHVTVRGNGTIDDYYLIEVLGSDISLQILEDFFPDPIELRGRGHLSLEALYHEGWQVHGFTEMENIILEGFEFSRMDGTFSWQQGEKILVDQTLIRDGNPLTIEGRIPLEEQMENLELVVQSQALALDFFPIFINDLVYSRGQAAVDIRIQGSMDQPQFHGWAQVEEGAFVYAGIPGTFSDIKGDLVLEGDRMVFRNADGRFNETGQLEMAGFMGIDGWNFSSYDLEIQGKELSIDHGSVKGSGSGDLYIEGPFSSPTITGEVDVYDTVLRLPFEWPQEVGTGSRAAVVPEVAIVLKPKSNVRLKDAYYDVLIQSGELQLDNKAGYFELVGEVESRQGSLNYYNTHFRLQEGRARFRRFQESIPSIYLRAQTRIQDTQVFIDLSGVGEDLNLELSSSPALSEDEILDLLIRRGGLGHLLQGDLGGVVREEFWRILGESFRSTFLAELETSVEEALELDEFSLTPVFLSNEGRLDLHVGKALQQNLYLNYSQTFYGDRDEKQLGLELRITDTLLLEGLLREEGEFQIGIEYNFSF